MDRKEAFDVVLSRLPEDKREEAVARLREVETRAEKLVILKDYGIEINSPEDLLGDDWDADGVDLTDDQLKSVAGGVEMTWERDCNCEP